MSSYFVAHIKIQDESEYQKYLDDCDAVFAKYKGQYLAVDNSPDVIEGHWDYTKTVLIRFNSQEELYQWYHSEAYQKILQYRLKGAVCDTVVVKGLD